MRAPVIDRGLWLTLALLLVAPAALAQQGGSDHNPPTPTTPVASPRVFDENAPPSEQQGDLLFARDRYVAAIRAYQGTEPKSAILYNKLGIACEHMRLNDQARESFMRALQLDPKFAQVYNNLGTLAHTQGDFKHAEKYYKIAIRLDPNNADSEKNLGTLYYSRGKFRKGDAAYRRARELDKDGFARVPHAPIEASTDLKSSADFHYHLARTYARAGSEQMAMDYLRKAINEGFRDRKRLLTDQEFAGLWNTPAFVKLVEDLKTN